MIEKENDPTEYIKGLQQILISDKKRIGFFFGSGTSLYAKKNDNTITVPAISNMTRDIVKELGDENEKNKNALDEIKGELTEKSFNIESILSNLEQKLQIIGNGKLNGLDKKKFEDLINKLKEKIKEKVSCHKSLDLKDYNKLVHSDFAEWIGQADRKYPIEIFTTNYDYLFELGLEYKNIPFYDGFTGSYKPFFNAESIEDFGFLTNQTKLWKVHGSLGWHLDKPTGKILREPSVDENILILPSFLKYNESKKQPYVSLMDRLTNFLKQDDSILITCGYSFSDEHINERILSALNSNTTSHVIALYFDKDLGEKQKQETLLYKIAYSNSKISVYGCRFAIVGCKLGKWKLRAEPDKNDTPNINLYFDEDAPINGNEDKGKEKKGEEIWTGEGEFMLPKFSSLVLFLKAMIIDNEIRKLGQNDKK
ncbi:MAG: SIR2 family protein [archaeon]